MPAQAHDQRCVYAFVGALFCGVCERRMQGHWINEAPYYRCRFPSEYALANKVRHPRNVYLRQDAFEADVNGWLTTVFAPHRLRDTIDQMIAGQQATGDEAAAEAATARISDANLKMTRYRAELDAGGDPEEIGKWITEAKAQRLQAEAELRQAATRTAMTRQQITDLMKNAPTSPQTSATPKPATWQAPTGSSACGSPTTQNANSCARQHARSPQI